jgi:hypothetical protein
VVGFCSHSPERPRYSTVSVSIVTERSGTMSLGLVPDLFLPIGVRRLVE